MLTIDGTHLTLKNIADVVYNKTKITISKNTKNKIDFSRKKMLEKTESSKPLYGINTGFGSLSEKKISHKLLQELQLRLIKSHAVGVGTALSKHEAKALMLIKANTLSSGYCGCSSKLVEYIVKLINGDCYPLIPQKGSVGASGDLAPLAHLALLIIGEGQAFIGEKKTSANKALKSVGLKPFKLDIKEGLSLINGTQAMNAVGLINLLKAKHLCNYADLIGAISNDVLLGSIAPFDQRIHELRPHKGQIQSAKNIRNYLHHSPLRNSHKNCSQVQDPYCLRCMPQVHGACRDLISNIENTLIVEANSITDNPLIFINDKVDILSGGNFHGQHLAFALDNLAMAACELASISERRIEYLLNCNLSRGLPAFLAADPGINSGYMILQVMCASLISENKVLSHPASVDSIPTSANKEDHVSMGMTAANKARTVIDNGVLVLSTELLCAAQGLDFRRPKKSSNKIETIHKIIRQKIPFRKKDTKFINDVYKVQDLIKMNFAAI